MITIIATFNVKNECTEKFQELASECIEASRKEEGNVDYHLYTG
ncbi:MAG: antibiotic biosynthesis monooxygenase, partial [Butyrivibrio sp.]|nr:antibiotic biosynthesis monooxygenase [Butyrivibrio sp.]